jgi:tetratricopeptide (TPR) repeat protein
VVLALLAAAQPAWAEPDAAAQLAAGDAARREFNLDGALTAYREAYRLAPANYEAAWKLARALTDKGTLSDARAQKPLYEEATTCARAAVKLQPRDSAGRTSLAIAVGKLALFEGGQRKVELSKEVKDEATRAVQLNPRDDLAYHVLGVWHREMVQLNWALRQIAQLLYGRFPPASLDNSIALLQRAVEIAPGNVAHHVELGTSYAAARRWAEADAALAKALSLPKTWVTDDHYKQKAKEVLQQVKRHRR